eukprot:GHVQ01003952.1.p1 GENE.GHVQ01003952.1~~GHVQ01003952.1.p1  ORF type:complete len:170 (-),score=32.87 GHVQ01003952.1:107-616(-)
MAVGMKFTLIPKRNKKAIYEYLFKEGVLVVQKDAKIVKHPEIGQSEEEDKKVDVPNLHVMMTLKSLHSRNYVDEKFTWQHHYYFLTNEGIEYLREYLHLPPSVFPATLTKKSSGGGGGRGGDRGGGDRGERRDRGEGGGINDEWRPRGGFGRGGGGGFGRGREREQAVM